MTAEPLTIGSEITFAPAGDGGTFFVTVPQTIPASGTLCSLANPPSTTITLQAVDASLVGTVAPAAVPGQSFMLATGDAINVNQNGPIVVAAGNTYGAGANANSCTPVGTNGILNVFGASAPPGSDTLNAGTGGVNATYAAC